MKNKIILPLILIISTHFSLLGASSTKLDNIEVHVAFKHECDNLFHDMEKYHEHVSNELKKHNHDEAKDIFTYKMMPKHKKWDRYCDKLYAPEINKTEEEQFLNLREKISRI